MNRLFSNRRNEEGRKIEISLPDELWTEIIFKYIPLSRWSSCLEKVSNQFHRCVLVAYKRLKSVEIRELFPLNMTEYEEYMRNKRKSEMSLDWLNEILEKLLLVCPFLIEVKLSSVISMLKCSHCNILRKFDRLQSISLDTLNFSPKFLANIVKECKNLKFLHTFYCTSVYNGRNARFDITTTNLTSIGLCDYAEFRQPDIFYFGSACENLTTLRVGSIKVLFQINDNDAKITKKFPNLETLTIIVRDAEDMQIIIKVLPNLHKLVHLNLFIRYQWTHYVSDFCDSLISLANRLESFYLRSPVYFEQLQQVLFTKCLNLHSLQINPLSLSTSVNQLPKLSGTLEKFSFGLHGSFLSQVSSMLMPNLLLLSNLTDLNLSLFYPQFSESCRGLYRLENLLHLRLPNKEPESIIGDDLLQFWATNGNGMLERLVTLVMPMCSLVTDVGGCLLAEKAKNLEVLKFSRSRITDKTISIFGDVSKKLKEATFQQNKPRIITVNAIVQLIKKCVYLKTVVLDLGLTKKLLKNKAFLPFIENVIVHQTD